MTAFTEYAPMLTADGQQTIAALEAATLDDADAARAYLTRVGALDLAECLGLAS